MTTITRDDDAPAQVRPRRRGALVLGAAGAVAVGAWAVATVVQTDRGGDALVPYVHQCQGLTMQACLTKADGWLLDRSRALSTGSTTTTDDFATALSGGMTGFAEISGFHEEPVFGHGEGKPATALHLSLTLRTEQGVTTVTRTFCPGQSPRLLPGKVACS